MENNELSVREYVLKKRVLITSDHESNDLLVYGSRGDVFRLESSHRGFYTALLHLLKTPSSIDELHSELNAQGVFVEKITLQCVIDDLLANYLVEVYSMYTGDVLNKLELEKYDRQLHFMASMGMSMRDAYVAQEQLKSKHAAVLGVGGVGGHTAYALAVMGIGELTIIDQDHIELSNTARQVLYDETDIGLKKVEVARKKLLKYNRNLKLYAVNKSVQCETDLELILRDKKIDVLLLTADTPRGEIQYIVDRVCHQLSIPFLHGCSAGDFVFVGPFIIPGKTKTLSQLINPKYQLTPEFKSIHSGFIASIIEPYNAIAANLIALEVFRLFTGMEKLTSFNRRHRLNLSNMSVSTEYYDA